jgi:hypothetical protein
VAVSAKFERIVSFEAKALGLDVSSMLLACADDVIK